MGTVKYILRVDFSCLADVNIVDVNQIGLNGEQKTATKFLIALFICMIVPGFIPSDTPVIGPIFSTLGTAGFAWLILGCLLLFKKDGKPIVRLKDIAQYVNWGILIQLAALFPIMAGLSSDEAGIKALIASTFSGMAGLSPFVFVLVIVFFSGLLTQVMNNGPCSALFVSAICMMSDIVPAGLNLGILAILIAFSTDMSCWLPSGNPANAYGYAQNDVVEFKYYFLYGFVEMIVALIIISVFGFAFANIF